MLGEQFREQTIALERNAMALKPVRGIGERAMMATPRSKVLSNPTLVIATADGTHTVEMNAQLVALAAVIEAPDTGSGFHVESRQGSACCSCFQLSRPWRSLRRHAARLRGWHTVATPLDIVSPPTSELVDQESHGAIDNVAYSDRFALKWGPDMSLDEATIDRILSDFAIARDTQVHDWEMNDPTGYGGTYFNVYIGDTGGAVPSVLGNAGYYTLDGAGYPMIVLNKDMLGDVGYAKSVIAHEFFHAVQHSHEAYFYEDTGLWYWETASWAGPDGSREHRILWVSAVVRTQTTGGSVPSQPRRIRWPASDLHQYGAFIFPWYISEELHVAEAVLASWRIGSISDDPMRILESILTEDVVAEALAQHAARSITWDYDRGEEFRAHVEGWAPHMGEHDHRFTALIPHSDPDFYTIPEERWPRAAGYAVMPIPDGAVTAANYLTVMLEGDPAAAHPSATSEAELAAVVVDFTDDGPVYHSIRRDLPHAMSGSRMVRMYGWLWPSGLLEDAFHPTPFKVSFIPLPDAPEPTDTGDPAEPEEPEEPGDPETPEEPPTTGESYVVPEADGDGKSGSGCAHAPVHPAGLLMVFALLGWRRSDTRGP